MKKLIHKFLSNVTREVENVETRQKEIATYWKLFGIVVKTTYEPLTNVNS